MVITSHAQRLAEALAEQFQSRGLTMVITDRPPADAGLVIDTSGLADWSALPPGTAQKAAIACARSVAATYERQGGSYIVLGHAGGTRSWQGGQAGLAKTASLEWPLANVKAILLEDGLDERDPDDIARRVMDEILAGGPDIEVVLSPEGRLVAISPEQKVVEKSGRNLPDGAVLLVSGGARGVTADCLVALATTGRYRFALLGRSQPEPWPDSLERISDDGSLCRALIALDKAQGRVPVLSEINARLHRLQASAEIETSLARLRDLGSDVRYFPCDIEDPIAVGETLAAVRADWGPIQGLIHGAGVLADKRIIDKTDRQVDIVFGPKVLGLKILLEALRQENLLLVALFSSVAARTGNVGQVDYAMANTILNQIARHEARLRPDCLVKSIGWGPWDGGMVDERVRDRFRSLGLTLIPTAHGGELFVQEVLEAPRAEVEVVLSAPFMPPEHIIRTDWTPGAEDLALMADHVIRGRAVLPVVLAAQKMLRFGRSALPNHPVVGLEDLEVLAGISAETADSFATETFRLAGVLRADSPDRVAVTLATGDGRIRYRAHAVAATAKDISYPSALIGPTMGLSVPEVYHGPLFHGPRFQVIDSLGCCGPDGADGVLVTGSGEGELDVALCDGGLQVALLWAVEQGLWPSLPIGIDRLHLGARPAAGQAVILRDRVTGRNGSVVTHDLTFLAGDAVVMKLSGLRMCRSPQSLVE